MIRLIYAFQFAPQVKEHLEIHRAGYVCVHVRQTQTI